MPAINTGLSSSWLVPGSSFQFNFLRAGGSLVTIPFTIALVGMKSAAGTAVAGTVYDATDAATTDALGGQSSEGAIMCRQANRCSQLFGQGPGVKVVFIAEPGSGTANVQTIAFVGTATSDGNIEISVAGRIFEVGVSNGNLQNTIAANAANELKKRAAELPVIVTVATNVVTLTHPTKGVNGKDVVVTVNQQISGCVATVATTAVGAGVADIQPALDALSPHRYDGIAIANHASADITEILLDIANRWRPQSKTWTFYYLFEPGTIGTATALAAAANHQSAIISNVQGCLNAPGEGAVTTAMLTYSRERANSGYDNAVVPLYPPPEAIIYTPDEVNTAITAGLTVYTGVLDASGTLIEDRMQCAQMVTSRTVGAGGFPDSTTRDIAVPRTAIALALQLDAAEAQLRANNPDGISQSQIRPLLKDLAASIMRAEARADPPVLDPNFVEDDIQATRIEPDPSVLGRNNALIQFHPDIPDHQTAWAINVIVGP